MRIMISDKCTNIHVSLCTALTSPCSARSKNVQPVQVYFCVRTEKSIAKHTWSVVDGDLFLHHVSSFPLTRQRITSLQQHMITQGHVQLWGATRCVSCPLTLMFFWKRSWHYYCSACPLSKPTIDSTEQQIADVLYQPCDNIRGRISPLRFVPRKKMRVWALTHCWSLKHSGKSSCLVHLQIKRCIIWKMCLNLTVSVFFSSRVKVKDYFGIY